MRLTGLALCLLASSLGARAESVEDRVAALEQRIKNLEQTLLIQSGGTNSAAASEVKLQALPENANWLYDRAEVSGLYQPADFVAR